jgi:hypothetical protein
MPPPRRIRFYLFELVGHSGDRFTLLDTKPNISRIPGYRPVQWYWYLSFNETPTHPQYGIASNGELDEKQYRSLRADPERLGVLRSGDELEPALWKWLLSHLQAAGATKEDIVEVFTGMRAP